MADTITKISSSFAHHQFHLFNKQLNLLCASSSTASSNNNTPPFSLCVRSSTATNTTDDLSQGQGPSCVLLGAPLDTATKENIEALYRQARKAYYSGKPIIKDDLFDKLELKLRSYGSKSVIKYPRCSLRRQSTYADAEEDPPQAFALASIWVLILAFGSSACLLPLIQAATVAYQHLYDSGISYSHHAFTLDFPSRVKNIIFIVLGSVIGYPVASASVVCRYSQLGSSKAYGEMTW